MPPADVTELSIVAATARLAIARRDEIIRQRHLEEGATLRELAIEAGLSPAGVARIAHREPASEEREEAEDDE